MGDINFNNMDDEEIEDDFEEVLYNEFAMNCSKTSIIFADNFSSGS